MQELCCLHHALSVALRCWKRCAPAEAACTNDLRKQARACLQNCLLGVECTYMYLARVPDHNSAANLSGGQSGPEDWHMPIAAKLQPPALIALALGTSVLVA